MDLLLSPFEGMRWMVAGTKLAVSIARAATEFWLDVMDPWW